MTKGKFKVVVELEHNQDTNPIQITSVATALIQQSFASIPGVSLVGVESVEEVTV